MLEHFPTKIETFHVDLIGGGTYGDPLTTRIQDVKFYTDGHPNVERVYIATYELVGVREVPVNRDPKLIATWHERNGR